MMKQLYLLLILIGSAIFANAQCTIDTTIQTWGFHPDTGSYLKPACSGSHYEEVIQVYAPSNVTVQFGTFPVNYVQLDSIPDFPPSLTYSTNPPNGYMAGGERGCISIYGVVNVMPGNYQFNIHYTANFMAFGNPVSLNFKAPYKLHVDSGAIVYSFFSDSTCYNKPYFYNNQWLTAEGFYDDTIPRADGCDSIVTLRLSIITNDTSVVVAPSGDALLAAAGWDNYKLVLCSTAGVISAGASDSLHIPGPGDYMVIMNKQGCADTSNCFTFTNTGIEDINTSAIKLIPNPGTEYFSVTGLRESSTIIVFDLQGKQLIEKAVRQQDELVDISQLSAGKYLVAIKSSGQIVYRSLQKTAKN